VSVTPARQFFLVYVSALSYVVASRGTGTHTYSFLFLLLPAVTRRHRLRCVLRIICTIASATLPGSFIRRSTRVRVQLPVPPYSRYPRDCWPLPVRLQHSPARGHPGSRLKTSARVIAILVRVLQFQYFSQPGNFILVTTRTRSPLFARTSVIAWRTTACTALYGGVSTRLLQ
jgi:hypothetical protein